MSNFKNILFYRFRDSVDYLCGGIAYLYSNLRRQMPPNLTPLSDVTKLSPAIYRILGQNPGVYTLQGTNTYLVGTSNKKILIDAGEENVKNYIDLLKFTLKNLNSDLQCIIATHYHLDHIGGIQDVLKLGSNQIPVYKLRRNDNVKDKNDKIFTYIDDGFEINVEGASLKLIHTPGHTCDHLIVYFKEENAIFSGDCILGETSTIFQDLHSYMNSLTLIKNINPSKIYPGHGPVIENPIEKINEYVNHRLKRELQIIDILKDFKDGTTPVTLTRTIYPNLTLSMRIGAIGNINQHLQKLVKDQVVEEVSYGIFRLIHK